MNPKRETELVFSALDCVLPDRSAIYACVPITSGKRLFSQWHRFGKVDVDMLRARHSDEYKTAVLLPNLADACAFVERVRQTRSSPVIDPSRFMPDEWQQEDFRNLWMRVIGKKARMVVVAPGWEWSHGCVVECTYAIQHGIPVMNEQGEALTRQEAEEMLSLAYSEATKIGMNLRFIQEALKTLRGGAKS